MCLCLSLSRVVVVDVVVVIVVVVVVVVVVRSVAVCLGLLGTITVARVWKVNNALFRRICVSVF